MKALTVPLYFVILSTICYAQSSRTWIDTGATDINMYSNSLKKFPSIISADLLKYDYQNASKKYSDPWDQYINTCGQYSYYRVDIDGDNRIDYVFLLTLGSYVNEVRVYSNKASGVQRLNVIRTRDHNYVDDMKFGNGVIRMHITENQTARNLGWRIIKISK